MDMYTAAALTEDERDAQYDEAVLTLDEAKLRVATLEAGKAIARLRELAPAAGSVQFHVGERLTGSWYAVVTRIGDQSSDAVLFDLGDDGSGDAADPDELEWVEDQLAAAHDNGYPFPRRPGGGEYEFEVDLHR